MDPPAGFVFDEEPTMTSQEKQLMEEMKQEIRHLRREVEAKRPEPARTAPTRRESENPAPTPPAQRKRFASINWWH